VYSVIVAAKESADPSIGLRSIDWTVAARGSVSISWRYFTSAKYEPSPLAEMEMLENDAVSDAAPV
jgi:hypothetical protein